MPVAGYEMFIFMTMVNPVGEKGEKGEKGGVSGAGEMDQEEGGGG